MPREASYIVQIYLLELNSTKEIFVPTYFNGVLKVIPCSNTDSILGKCEYIPN